MFTLSWCPDASRINTELYITVREHDGVRALGVCLYGTNPSKCSAFHFFSCCSIHELVAKCQLSRLLLCLSSKGLRWLQEESEAIHTQWRRGVRPIMRSCVWRNRGCVSHPLHCDLQNIDRFTANDLTAYLRTTAYLCTGQLYNTQTMHTHCSVTDLLHETRTKRWVWAQWPCLPDKKYRSSLRSSLSSSCLPAVLPLQSHARYCCFFKTLKMHD